MKAETAATPALAVTRGRNLVTWLWPVADAGGVIAPLDGLRGIAVLLVMSVHLCLLAPGPGMAPATAALLGQTKGFWAFGVSGVNLFFILSGFLLFLPYGRALLQGRSLPSSRAFYIRRALRILPAYWASLLLLALLFDPQGLSPAHLYDLALHIALLHNWSARTFYSFNVPFWTMAIEAQFYLLLPLLAAGMARALRGGRRRLFAVLLGLVVLASPAYGLLAWGVYRTNAMWADHVAILNVFGYFTVFGLGAGCSLIYLGATENRTFLGARLVAAIPRLARAAGVVGLGLLAVFFVVSSLGSPIWDHEKLIYWLAGNPLLAFGYAGILLGVLLGWPAWRIGLATPVLRFAGVISYSLYIWHYPLYEHLIMPITRTTGAGLGTLLVAVLLTAVITIPFSFVFYTCVERPFLRVRRSSATPAGADNGGAS